MENLNVWIHCRVSTERSKDVLDYQENKLKRITDNFDMCVVGITRQVTSGNDFSSFGMQQLMTAIKRGKVDAVLVYSYKRIAVDEDLLEEFLMFCQMYDVRVWALNDIED
ncbi:recombinase family protein, partial [Candidatus Stoquefichus massiliensis]|uniref:recombinase family protein n=1 Tax=Candidatus Stoquefichus massiliensis TaxID=1470350 RepID=UPI000488AE41